MSYAIAVDIGGTFTDLVAFDHETHRVVYSKSPTTYDNLVEGILDCFNKAKIKPAEASLVNHGTTLVITDPIRGLAVSGAPTEKLRELAIAEGMRTLRQDAVSKVLEGVTTFEEMLRVVFVSESV